MGLGFFEILELHIDDGEVAMGVAEVGELFDRGGEVLHGFVGFSLFELERGEGREHRGTALEQGRVGEGFDRGGAVVRGHGGADLFEVKGLVLGDAWFDARVDAIGRGERLAKGLALPERIDRERFRTGGDTQE